MSSPITRTEGAVEYPESDGLPMADNTLQFRWIVTLKEGLANLFRDDPNVFVAGDLFWYPVEGDPRTVLAPDTMVAFGRPRGDRGSYRQWDEGGVAPQVVFEVLSPNNRPPEMARKLAFYDRFGVEEYYVYDPDHPALEAHVRDGSGRLRPIAPTHGWVSPRLGIRFDLSGPELQVFAPDGSPFLSYVELAIERDQAERRRDQAERRRDAAERQRDAAEHERVEAVARLEAERLKAERLAERLRQLGIDPDA